MILKLTTVLSLAAVAIAYPVTYVSPEQAQQLQDQQLQAGPQPQYRYVPQAPRAAAYQQEAQQQQQVVYQQAPAQRAVYQQPQQQVVYQQPQQLQQRPRKLRPVAEQRVPIGADGRPSSLEDQEYDANPSPYQFSFDVRDDLNTNYQNRKEQREGDKITGSYSVVDSDGFIRTVKYTADPLEGFKAEVTREPTDIKVVIPTPPPAQLSHRQQQTQQYLEAAPQLQQPQAQVYNSLANPQQYVRRPAAARAPARQQYAEQAEAQQYAAAPAQQPQYVAAAPAQRAKPAQYFAPQQAAQYQTYAQQ